MFTGIIRQVGVLTAAERAGAGRRLSVEVGTLAGELSAGDSLAVSGVCLTVTEIRGTVACLDVVAQTLERTTLGRLGAAARVNLERALRVGEGLDGHFVQGHVDGLARVVRFDRAEGRCELRLTCERALTGQMVAQGSVALDGVSLTLATLGEGSFSVALIPTTLAATTLGERRAGDELNLETDVLGKYVRRMLGGHPGAGVAMETLRRTGFA